MRPPRPAVRCSRRPLIVALLCTTIPALLASAVPRAWAQSELRLWVDPDLGKVMGRGDYRLQFYSTERVEQQGTRLNLDQHNITFQHPLFQNETNEWTFSARLRYQDYETEAVFPDSGTRFPDQLVDVRLGLSYRHKFENQWTLGVSVTAGSASDKPFHSKDELIGLVAAVLRVPRGERDAWLFSLIYSSDEEIFGFRHVVTPGIAYVWNPNDKFTAVIGLPFSAVEYKPIEDLTLEASFFPTRTVRARATYVIFPPLRVFIGLDTDHDAYYLADRGDKDDQLFYYEKRVSGGMRFDLRHVGLEITGGYVWDRFYFIGEKYSERNENRFNVGSGTFVGFRLSSRW
jgi:hypothetical protein